MVSRVVQPVLIGEESAKQSAQFQQLVPILARACQSAHFQPEDQSDVIEADFGQQPLETEPPLGRSSTASLVFVDDEDAIRWPAEVGGSVREAILSVGRFAMFRDLPTFPYIGGALDIVWNSPNCGSCWKLTNIANNESITITTIDTAGHGFNIAESAFEDLNGGEVGEGVVQVEAHRVPIQVCGL